MSGKRYETIEPGVHWWQDIATLEIFPEQVLQTHRCEVNEEWYWITVRDVCRRFEKARPGTRVRYYAIGGRR